MIKSGALAHERSFGVGGIQTVGPLHGSLGQQIKVCGVLNRFFGEEFLTTQKLGSSGRLVCSTSTEVSRRIEWSEISDRNFHAVNVYQNYQVQHHPIKY